MPFVVDLTIEALLPNHLQGKPRIRCRSCQTTTGHHKRGCPGLRQTVNIAERFWQKVERAGSDDCWPWRASGNPKGYGIFWVGGKGIPAHRFAYESLVEVIPEGLTIDHLCRNHSCVNPAHMEPVPGRENTLRGATLAALAAHKTHCPQGHPYNERNTYTWHRHRRCRECKKLWNRQSRLGTKEV